MMVKTQQIRVEATIFPSEIKTTIIHGLKKQEILMETTTDLCLRKQQRIPVDTKKQQQKTTNKQIMIETTLPDMKQRIVSIGICN